MTWPTLDKVSKNGKRERESWDFTEGDSQVILSLLPWVFYWHCAFFWGSEVQLCFKSPTEPEAFFPLVLLILLDMLIFQKEVLCPSLYLKWEQEPESAAASGLSAQESNSLCFHEESCCVGKWDILLLMVATYTHQSNGKEKLWNSFLYDQILLKIRKTNGNQRVQAYS